MVDILIIGNLAGIDLLFAESLIAKGINCGVLRNKNSGKTLEVLSTYHKHFKQENIIYYRNEIEFIKFAKKSRLIFSFTGALISALGKLWPLRNILGLPPVINLTTGADITELAKEKSLSGRFYRQYLRFSDLNWCAHYPHALNNIIDLRVPNVIFMTFPFYVLNSKELPVTSENTGKTITFFHPSNLDWKVKDNNENRNSSKGNDRFIRAFARAVKGGFDCKCIILDRGSDKEAAKDLIKSLGVEDRFIWKSHLDRDDLFKEYIKADVIVDQFDIGGLGSITIESMALGKPVLVYLQKNCFNILYKEIPPVMNCCSEEEIYNQILTCKDRKFLDDIGIKSREWVYKHHYWETCLDQFLFYYTLLTGHKVVDYGWDIKKVESRGD